MNLFFFAKKPRAIFAFFQIYRSFGSWPTKATSNIQSKITPTNSKFLNIWNYWNDVKVQRNFFDILAKELNFKTWEDWYQVHPKEVISRGGKKLMQEYNNSLINALMSIYPEYSWKKWMFKPLPVGFFRDIKNQKREYLNDVAKKLELKNWSDWYNIRVNEIDPIGQSMLAEYHSGSLVKALLNVYPEYAWDLTEFKHTPKGVLDSVNTQRTILDKIGKELGIKNWEDWYSIQLSDVAGNQGLSGILSRYGNSLLKTLMCVYPEHDWKIYKFDRVPEGYWRDTKNQREFLDDIFKQLNLKHWEDWYGVTVEQVQQLGGSGLINIYGNSMKKVLMRAFPEYDWQMHKFLRVPNGFWIDEANAIEVLEYAAKKLGVKKFEDWYSVPSRAANAVGLRTLIERHGGLIPTLAKYFPEFQWNNYKLPRHLLSGKVQHILHKFIEEIFPKMESFGNYIHPYLVHTESDKHVEFDVFIPSLNLAFEYQVRFFIELTFPKGEQHYHFHYLYGTPQSQKNRDEDKRILCEKAKITLIEIPYWWDQSKDSLMASIYEIRPDIITEKPTSEPIPKIPPSTSIKYSKTGSTEFKIAPPPVQLCSLGKFNMNTITSNHWWATERKEGIRAYWNGETQLYFENGSPIYSPEFFTEALPKNFPVDGELFLDVSKDSSSFSYDEIYTVIARRPRKADSPEIKKNGLQVWKHLKFRGIDAPTLNEFKFESRMEKLLKCKENEIFCIAKYQKVENLEHLRKIILEYENNSEGILLKKPNCEYYDEDSFLNASNYETEEVLVTDHKLDNEGKVILQTQGIDGKNYLIPFHHSNFNMPSIGSIITFKYSLDSINSLPQYLRTRPEFEWEDVLQRRHEIPYYITIGGKGQPPKCRGCGIRLDKNSLRIQVWGKFLLSTTWTRNSRFSFCFKKTCLESGTHLDLNVRGHIASYPPFQNRIRIPSKLKELVKNDQISTWEGIDWVVV